MALSTQRLERVRVEHEALATRAEALRLTQQKLEQRLAEAGPGSGAERKPALDRIALAAWLPLSVAFCLLFFQFHWHRYILRDPTVYAAILWLGSPALWAALIAWPYRRVSRACRVAWLTGLALALVPAIHLVVTLALGHRR